MPFLYSALDTETGFLLPQPNLAGPAALSSLGAGPAQSLHQLLRLAEVGVRVNVQVKNAEHGTWTLSYLGREAWCVSN